MAALGAAYERRGDETLRDAAIAKAEGYRADAVFDAYWRPILAAMEAGGSASEPIPINRAARRQAQRKRRSA